MQKTLLLDVLKFVFPGDLLRLIQCSRFTHDLILKNRHRLRKFKDTSMVFDFVLPIHVSYRFGFGFELFQKKPTMGPGRRRLVCPVITYDNKENVLRSEADFWLSENIAVVFYEYQRKRMFRKRRRSLLEMTFMVKPGHASALEEILYFVLRHHSFDGIDIGNPPGRFLDQFFNAFAKTPKPDRLHLSYEYEPLQERVVRRVLDEFQPKQLHFTHLRQLTREFFDFSAVRQLEELTFAFPENRTELRVEIADEQLDMWAPKHLHLPQGATALTHSGIYRWIRKKLRMPISTASFILSFEESSIRLLKATFGDTIKTHFERFTEDGQLRAAKYEVTTPEMEKEREERGGEAALFQCIVAVGDSPRLNDRLSVVILISDSYDEEDRRW